MKHVFTVILLLSGLSTFCQSNFKSGYLVSTSGDTIKGLIQVKEWNNNPKSLKFKNGPDADPKQYETADLQSFEVPGFCRYIRYAGQMSVNRIERSLLSQAIDTSFVVDTVFLKEVMHGPLVSLFSYSDNIKKRFFITSQQHPAARELLNYPYMLSDRLLTFSPYKQLLREIVAELNMSSEKQTDAIEASVYSELSLKKTLSAINRTKGEGIKPVRERSMALIAGISLNRPQVRFEGDHRLAANNRDTRSDILPALAIGVDFYTNPKVGKLIVRGLLSCDLQQQQIESTYNPSPGRTILAHYDYTVSNLSLTPSLLYNLYNGATYKAYLSAGFSMNKPIVHKSTYSRKIIESFYAAELQRQPDIEEIGISKFWYGVTMEAGVSRSGFTWFFNAGTALNGISADNMADYQMRFSILNSGVRYKFRRKF